MSFQMPTKLTSRFIVNPAYGTARDFNFNQNSHTVQLPSTVTIGSEAGTGLRYKKVAISTLSSTETDLFTLPAGAIVLDVIASITDASAEVNTIMVGTQGTSNDPDGFLVGVPTNALATISARSGVVVTVGGTETYISAKYAGAFMTNGYIVGTNAASDFGLFVPAVKYFADADPVSYTLSGATTSFAATITVVYLV